MIIPEDDVPNARAKALAEAEAASLTFSSAPPPYEPRPTTSTPLLPNSSSPVQPYAHVVPPPNPYSSSLEQSSRVSPTRRFWTAFGVAILIWWLMTMFIGSTVGMRFRGFPHGNRGPDGGGYEGWPGRPGHGNLPKDTTLRQCSVWEYGGRSPYSPYEGSARTSFRLPLSSATLFLFSRGPSSAGTIDLVILDEETDYVRVGVDVTYTSLAGARACQVQRGTNENGVGLFTTPDPSGSNNVHFRIVVAFPRGMVNNFETEMDQFVHNIAALDPLVTFKNISMTSKNSPILVHSLTADTASITTSNGVITGHYTSTQSLRLTTANAHVQASVTLRKTNTTEPSPKFLIRTSNGYIYSDVLLEKSTNTNETFIVDALTQNQPITLLLDPRTSFGADLQLSARSSNAMAIVRLPPTYEGKFLLSTSNGNPTIEGDDTVKDPAGRGRIRTIDVEKNEHGAVEGEISWGGDRRGRGRVDVHTSNSPVILKL